MKRKDFEPIKFEIFQSDMERYMRILGDTLQILSRAHRNEHIVMEYQLRTMKDELQHKIDMHIERGEWK